jgi:hypothetical protein
MVSGLLPSPDTPQSLTWTPGVGRWFLGFEPRQGVAFPPPATRGRAGERRDRSRK